MIRENEHEIVCLLERDDYQTILQHFDVFQSDAKPQRNHYFTDPEGVLERNNLTLRVREKSDTFEIQMKIPKTESDDGMLEIRQIIPFQYFNEIKEGKVSFPDEICYALEHLGIKSVSYVGYADTKRIEKTYKEVEGAWMMDETSFPLGYTDYRLELEYEKNKGARAKELFSNLLRQKQIPEITPSSKFKVFMEKMREHEKIQTTLRNGAEKERRRT